MFALRYRDRYVSKEIEVEGLGSCLVSLSVSGFGECLSVDKEGENIFYGESNVCDEDYEEDESAFYITVGYPFYKDYVILKSRLYK